MPDTAISALQEKINKIIDELGQDVIALVEPKEFEGKIDFFPFFSLIVNLEKSLYENIINSFAKSGTLDKLLTSDKDCVEDFTPLIENWGITRTDTKLVFPSLASFKKKRGENNVDARHNHLMLDTERLFPYIKALERFLCNTTTAHFLLSLYRCFNLDGEAIRDYSDPFRGQPYKKEGSHYVLNPELTSGTCTISTKPIDIALKEDGWDEESMGFFLSDLFNDSEYTLGGSDSSSIDNLWALFTDEEEYGENTGHNPKYSNGEIENRFVFELKENKKINNQHKKRFLDFVKQTLVDKTIQGYLQLFIDICQHPAFAMPDGILLNTLQQTYDNMFQAALSRRLKAYSKAAGIKKIGDLYEKVAIPNARNKIENDFGYYRDKTLLKEAEIEELASVLGVESYQLKQM